MFLISQWRLVKNSRVVCVTRFCSKQPPELPEEPTTCCMSGCANCVWIEYADKVRSILANSDSKQVSQIVLDKIQDPNMKAFLSMELKSKGLYVDLDVESFTDASDEFAKLLKLSEQSHLEYEDLKTKLNETNKEINHYDEQLNIIERERVKLMSELALQMQIKHDLKNKVEGLKSILQSTEFDLKKYNKMKLNSADLDILSHTKKTFITYKNILKVYFDYSNGPNATTQKGYTFNRITKKLAYFEFNTDEKTDNEIAVCLWNKIKLVSDKNWEMLTE